jgi:hydroxyacylglutathione hydrolase
MFFKKIETEGIAHYAYMVGDGAYVAVIDPVRDMGIYMHEARKAGLKIAYIFETHRNEDFISGSRELGDKTGATVYISGHEDLGYKYGETITDGFEIELGAIRIKAIHTPGHTLGHLSYAVYENDNANPCMVFTGDCLFMGDVGRTDFYGKKNLGKMTALLYDSIFEKLLPLGDEVLMFPAHGPGSACGESMDERPFSTLGYERKYSEVLQVNSKDEFVKNLANTKIKPRYFEMMEILNVKGAEYVGEQIILNALTFGQVKESKDEVLLLDIRTKGAYTGGHVPGSIYMSKDSIATFLGAIYDTKEKIAFLSGEDANDLEEVYWHCRRIGFDNIVGYIPDATSQWVSNGEELEIVPTISAITYASNPPEGEFILLDIRKEYEIKEGDPSENRLHIPLQILYEHLDELKYDIPIYVLCNSGERATIGYSYLTAKGYDAIVIAGGIEMLDASNDA